MVLEKARFLRVFLFECAAANRRRFRSVLLVPLIFLMPSRPPGDRFGGDVERISTSVSVMETVSDRVAEHHEKYLDCSSPIVSCALHVSSVRRSACGDSESANLQGAHAGASCEERRLELCRGQ